MSIINCTSHCVYEENGKCTLDHVDITSCTTNEDCVFFQTKSKGLDHKEPLKQNNF